jgi:hypothetical protein
MIDFITADDLLLVKRLNAIHYKNKGMTGVVSPKEVKELLGLRKRLKKVADFFKARYDPQFGAFESGNSTGNPVGRDGNLRRVWSGIFKGSENKQYAAQISFVINTTDVCLDVGFYFGRASAFGLEKSDRQQKEDELRQTGALLAARIAADDAFARNTTISSPWASRPKSGTRS